MAITFETGDLPKGWTPHFPRINETIEVKIFDTWNKADYVGVNRWGNLVVCLMDKSVHSLTCFHEIRPMKEKDGA